jgi:hypothetical protein
MIFSHSFSAFIDEPAFALILAALNIKYIYHFLSHFLSFRYITISILLPLMFSFSSSLFSLLDTVFFRHCFHTPDIYDDALIPFSFSLLPIDFRADIFATAFFDAVIS